MSAAKLIDSRVHIVPGKLRVTEYFFEVPLDYSQPDGETLRLFGRGVRRHVVPHKDQDKLEPLPWLVYLQGGPGFGCQPPQSTSFVPFLLDKGYEVLLLDQRGTGMSTTITAATLRRRGDAQKQAEYLRHFRADNIVRDCEAVRRLLTADHPEDLKKWTVLGQSYGGFCIGTYLSFHPEGLKEVFITGGVPPVSKSADLVYEKTYAKVKERNQAYYQKFPEDADRIKRIYHYLQENKPRLPSGYLTPARFQQLGIAFGQHGGLDTVHDIVLRATIDLDMFGFLTRPTLLLIDGQGAFDRAVIYAVLHESIYCERRASNWSAEKLRSKAGPEFEINLKQSQIYFTGEMIYKDMFESYDELKDLREVADILASYEDWPILYDSKQLARNEVPAYAAIYVDDMYVDFSIASETARAIRNFKPFITNAMYHGALSDKTEDILRQLFSLKEDTID
ncbi:hypothetical protein VTN49DRAFT_3465 [Thermomyces lanuginosus]|uniref:uncharacterized protein n=1 Tax=Thermomyces lanuginosus TaxID=5541 RepID=UPI003743D12F